jgi:hypothetical protein
MRFGSWLVAQEMQRTGAHSLTDEPVRRIPRAHCHPVELLCHFESSTGIAAVGTVHPQCPQGTQLEIDIVDPPRDP